MGPRPAQRLRAPTALPPSGPEIAFDLRPGAVVGPWRLEDRLGRGVYRAVDVASGSPVVVKVGPPEAIAAEAAALAAVAHPHLARLARAHAGAIATEYVSGPSLAAFLLEGGRVPWSAAAALLAPVADAVAALHRLGFVHGDISPANVVLGEHIGAVLVDLDRAHRIGHGDRAGGTPGSVAPEVVAGAPSGPAADVWSLAAVVVEAVTGAVPTAAMTLPPGVALALRRSLAEDPSDRPGAGELAAALHAGAAPTAPSACPPPDPLENRGDARARVTRDYGPRPPAPAVVTVRARPRRSPVAVAVAALALGAGALVVVRPADVPTAEAGPTSCPPIGSGTLLGDPDGDGCATAAQWSHGVLTVVLEPGAELRRYALGAAGDVVALADWDCDGDDTPGLYRPSTGEITLYDTWPGAGPGAAPSVVTTGDALPDQSC